jgi:hypothetical protein
VIILTLTSRRRLLLLPSAVLAISTILFCFLSGCSGAKVEGQSKSLFGVCFTRCYLFLAQMRKVEEDGSCSDLCVLFSFQYRRRGYECGSCKNLVDPTKYNTGLGLDGVPSEHRQAFTDAASRWDDVIVGDIPKAHTLLFRLFSQCGRSLPNTVDDIFICAKFMKIDGPGRILARAGSEFVRHSSKLPITGKMEFDSEDVERLVAAGDFDNVIVSCQRFLLTVIFNG